MDIFTASPALTGAYFSIVTAIVVILYLFFALLRSIAARLDETPEERAKRTRYGS